MTSGCRRPGLAATLVLAVSLVGAVAAHGQRAGEAVDVSLDFQNRETVYFIPDRVVEFDQQTGRGILRWRRHMLRSALSFNKIDAAFVPAESNEFPATEYDRDPELPFEVVFVSPRTVRLRFATRDRPLGDGDSLMLDRSLAKTQKRAAGWNAELDDDGATFSSPHARLRLQKNPWRIELYDGAGRLLTRTRTVNDPMSFSVVTPFSFVRRPRDLGHSTAASFLLAPDEKIFGCGESFTRLNKRGQRIELYTRDGMGAQTQKMYKPIPFYLSSQGYGVFIHTSTPVTCDFGHDFDQAAALYTGDETLDLFLFVGDPKEVLSEYTALTGRSPTPPVWSFGLWMSRITYKSEQEVRAVAARLRQDRIPCDVIHLDTGWFENDWQCNYRFSPSRFPDPKKMIDDLRRDGFRISLWQLPYFTDKNELFDTIVSKGYEVKNPSGRGPYLDAVLDFSNPDTVTWYQGLLADLLKVGVAAIKVDFGEDSPLGGVYASGRTGWYEHNLYPLRYNHTVAEITKQTTGEDIIWARSAWAGSQRYPLHWGGDAENTDSAMAATLRAGMSLGLCGFTFWSHDVGGFVGRPDADLYRRWLAFGVLTSHIRCHGAPPREPWEYGDQFEDDFRRVVELRYSLLPYIYAQARAASTAGHPMLRPLFFEYPDDPGCWLIEDQYLFGRDLLVAPLFHDAGSGGRDPESNNDARPRRSVYLPPGQWIDYQTGQTYRGAKWHEIEGGAIPIILLVRSGAAIPHAAVAPSTDQIDWKNIELRVFATKGEPATAQVALPNGELHTLRLTSAGDQYVLEVNPLESHTTFRITSSGP